MAEYKNGVNFRGNMSVEADDINPDVKTGRVVFIDEDLYESNEAYKAKVDKCVEEGFMRSDEAGSGGSSGGNLITETRWVDDIPNNNDNSMIDIGFITIADASEIESVIKSGGNVVVHFDPSLAPESYANIDNGYLSLTDYYPDGMVSDSFDVTDARPMWCSGVRIENGKIFFAYYQE